MFLFFSLISLKFTLGRFPDLIGMILVLATLKVLWIFLSRIFVHSNLPQTHWFSMNNTFYLFFQKGMRAVILGYIPDYLGIIYVIFWKQQIVCFEKEEKTTSWCFFCQQIFFKKKNKKEQSFQSSRMF